eukprot:g5400.t1.1.5e174189 g5400  g5400.t1 contig2:463915-466254(-)
MSSSSGVFKRVISSPETMAKSERDGKITKTGAAASDVVTDTPILEEPTESGALLEKLVLADDADADEAAAPAEIKEDDDDYSNHDGLKEEDIADLNVPVATVHHQSRASSTTNSSLSDEGNISGEDASNNGEDDDNNANNNNGNEANPPAAAVAQSSLTRAVSHDDSLTKSVNSNSSEGMRQSSVGNWGWFEDVHGHESAFLPDLGGRKKDEEGNNDGGKGGGKKKKGGLLQMGQELMQSALNAIVEPQREANTMAVTAPTYVLEESLSSQKLWRYTAGNRPPQPVEERAFFEQVWAQNFARSKVKYEIPVEVLTASTPISISPFNDDGFGDDGAGGPGGNLSNYNLAAPFNVKSGDEHAANDPASVKAAQADAAEATLIHKLNSNGAVEMYFDPNRPKDYNLKTLGPHHHHHTLVNKKITGAGSDNELTVVVRGDNVFGTTVSKSFPRVDDKGQPIDGIDTVSISIASYRVVESKKHGKYAQFLVIFCDGNFRNTIGVWKRYSDFSELSRKVTHGHSESCAAQLNPLSVTDDNDNVEILPNAITSWRLLKKRQRWYRCLDTGYLSLKVS